MKVCFKKISTRAVTPTYATAFSAGADLHALLTESSEKTVAPGQTVLFGTGIAVAIPEGYVGLIYARSGLSVKSGLAPANKVGVIDADYRGELKVALYNHGSNVQTVCDGDRIAQLLITPVFQADFTETDCLPETDRGEGGFGSTGKN